MLDFLLGRAVEIRIGKEYSRMYSVENVILHGSVCSLLLFNIMINDVFEQVEQGLGNYCMQTMGQVRQWSNGQINGVLNYQ